MKKYLALLSQKNRSLFTQEFLAEHVNHLQRLKNEGILICCGPFTDGDTAMQLVYAEDMDAAESIIKSDPFLVKGFYEKVEIRELIEATEENNWLMD